MSTYQNSVFATVANVAPLPAMSQRKIRCIVGDFFTGKGEQVAEAGKTYVIDADVARALVKFGRAEFV